MRKSARHEYRQAYNPQAVVDAGGTQLIVVELARLWNQFRSARMRCLM